MLDRKQVVSLSGGRSSAYMLYRLLTEEQEKERIVLFYNTGKERMETLDFVAEIATRWQVGVTWLEYDYDGSARGTKNDPRHTYRIVSRETAGTDGEPFQRMIAAGGGFLPNVHRRRCTQELKVRTGERYLKRHLGLPRAAYVENLGIRYDEPRRWQRAMAQEECRVYYPLVERKTTKADVAEFWQRQPFDLGIDSEIGNCDLCFLKGKRNLLDTIRREPARAQFWIDLEESTGNYFSDRHTYRELLAAAHYQDLPIFADDEPDTDCYCGD